MAVAHVVPWTERDLLGLPEEGGHALAADGLDTPPWNSRAGLSHKGD